MKRQVVYEIATGRVLMAGTTDFTQSDHWDPAVYAMIENETHVFAPLTNPATCSYCHVQNRNLIVSPVERFRIKNP